MTTPLPFTASHLRDDGYNSCNTPVQFGHHVASHAQGWTKSPPAVPSFRRNDLQAVFVEDSIDFKEVKDLSLDAERKDRILRNDRGQREASRKHPHRTS